MYPDADEYDVSARERVYGRATTSSEGRRSLVIVLLTVSIFVLIVSLSCRQATAPGPGRNILEAGLVTLVDIDQMIADDGPALRQFALESDDPQVVIPGYPLDIVFTREEVAGSTDAQLRELILERSSALLYAEGIEAFDRTGDQSLRRFSLQGLLEFGVRQVSRETHNRATIIMFVALVGCVIFGALAGGTGEGWGRMRSLGLSAAAGALPGILLFFLLRLIVGQMGGDDPFIAGYRDITNAALGVPLRNSIIVFVAGAMVVVISMGLSRLERTTSSGNATLVEDDY